MKRLLLPAIIVVAVLFAGCKKYKVEYNQPAQVEFKPISVTLAKGTTSAPGSTTILVQLIGPQRDQDLTVDYSVDPASTAVEGTHYVTSGTVGKVKIAANSSSGQLTLTAIPGNLTSSKKLILVLQDGTLPVSPNYKTSTITLQ